MKAALRVIREGWPLFSRKGHVVLVSYAVTLVILGILDGVALYLLATVFRTGVNSSSGEITVGTSAIRLGLIVALFVARSGLSSVATWITTLKLAYEENQIALKRFRMLMNPLTLLGNNPLSDFYNSVERGPRELTAITFNFVSLIAELLTGFMILAALLIYQPLTAVIALLYFLAIALLQHGYLSEKSQSAGKESTEGINAVYRLLGDAAGLRKLVGRRASSLVHAVEERHLSLTQSRGLMTFYATLPRYFLEFVFALGLVVIGGLTYLATDSGTAFAATTLFVAAGFRLLPTFNRAQALLLSILSFAPSANLVLVKYETVEPQAAEKTRNGSMALELEDVTFAYPSNSTPVLKSIDLCIERGKQYAIVGQSGAGKTTLADIFLGLNVPQCGRVRRALGLSHAYVPQDTFVASASLSQNVALTWGDSDIDFRRVRDALERARLSCFLDRVNDPSPIRGDEISGGQRQRLGLARAFYADANFIVLDEVTSALDVDTEREIYSAINSVRGSATVIIIAHRLSTIQSVDSVFYLEDGEIIGTGTFAQLERSLSQFRNLIELSQIRLED